MKPKRAPRHAPAARFKRYVKPAPEPAPEPAPPNKWEVLTALIQDYADAAVAESWKGGGDPADCEVLELQLELARKKVLAQLEKMQREEME